MLFTFVMVHCTVLIKLTAAFLHCITKTALDILSASDAAAHRRNRHPQKCIPTESRDQKPPPLLTRLPVMTTFPHVSNMLVCLLLLVWAFSSCLLRSCYTLLSIIKRKLSDYLHIKMLFMDFRGNLKETCAQRSPCIQRSPEYFPKVTVIRLYYLLCKIFYVNCLQNEK